MGLFEVKVNYTKQLENGNFKKVTEKSLFSAESFTDSETRAYEKIGETVRGEFKITGIVQKDYIDVIEFPTTDERWFEIQVRMTSQGIDMDKVKVVKQKYLVSADSIKEALTNLDDEFKKLTISDATIVGIKETEILDVYPLEEDLDIELSRTDVNSESKEEVEDETETEDSEEYYRSETEIAESQN